MEEQETGLSTAEAEYVALLSAAQECVWMKQLNSELGNPPDGPTTIMEDNKSSIAMAKNHNSTDRAEHIDIRHHFVREQMASETRASTHEMVTDMLTKGLTQQRFFLLRKKAPLTRVMSEE